MSCEHLQCDFCLSKQCNNPDINERSLKTFGNLRICPDCLRRAVHSTYNFVTGWGGIMEKECGAKKAEAERGSLSREGA